MENQKKEEMYAQEWDNGTGKRYWENELIALKDRREAIEDRLQELSKQWTDGEISREEYLETQELLKELNETNAKIQAIELRLDDKTEFGTADAESDGGIQMVASAEQAEGVPDIDAAEVAAHALEHMA